MGTRTNEIIRGSAMDQDGQVYTAIECLECQGIAGHVNIVNQDSEYVVTFYDTKRVSAMEQASAFLAIIQVRRKVAESFGIATEGQGVTNDLLGNDGKQH